MNQQGIVRAAYAELRKIAEREGPEGQFLLEQSEFCVDLHTGMAVLSLQFGRNVVWKQQLPFSKGQIDNGQVTAEAMEASVVMAMRKTLSLAGQAEHARLNLQFPKAIERVEVEYMPDIAQKNFKVFFKNGHVAEGSESEIRTDYFLARCAMIYDLPPL